MRFAVFTFLAVMGLAHESGAVPLCDDEQSLVPVAEVERPVADVEMAPKERDGPRTVDVILPCSVAESGELGPLCVDATGWLITQTGVVLCQISLFEAVFEPLAIDDRPVETLATLSSFLAAGLHVTTPALSLPIGHDRFLTPLACTWCAGTDAVTSQIVPG